LSVIENYDSLKKGQSTIQPQENNFNLDEISHLTPEEKLKLIIEKLQIIYNSFIAYFSRKHQQDGINE
jgi:hypothetical protein